MDKIEFSIWEKEVSFEFPEALDDAHETFYQGCDVMEVNPALSERIFKELIDKNPNSFLDAYVQLSHIYQEQEKWVEALAISTRAYFLGKQALDENLPDDDYTLPWGMIDNRPFLRSCMQMGMLQNRIGKYKEANKYFEYIIEKNPGDNQGARCYLIYNYLKLAKYKKLFSLWNSYEKEGSHEWFYGLGLACFLMNKRDKGKELFQKGKEKHPLVHKELIKKRHSIPKEGFSPYGGGVYLGSPAEAYLYWKQYEEFYTDQDLIDFLKSI